ncbi:MAG: ribose-5-phosphate isomerase RpiA [Rhodobiaceae bacterium]|nr:ribose-5-phosphate isomerase RpiA [Rhodobiaceae bacterium]
MADLDALKKEAAAHAVAQVRNGMKLGLGTGSTAAHFVRLLAERISREGLEVVGVPTSEATAKLARETGVPLTTLDETPKLDLTVDGADEIDPDLMLIKGGGGALLREKIVAAASDRMIVIADATKWVGVLGAFPLPVEIVRFGAATTASMVEAALASAGCSGKIAFRMKDGERFVTDEGHYIVDCDLRRIPQVRTLAGALTAVPGVVEHGLFIDLCDMAILAAADGIVVHGSL